MGVRLVFMYWIYVRQKIGDKERAGFYFWEGGVCVLVMWTPDNRRQITRFLVTMDVFGKVYIR